MLWTIFLGVTLIKLLYIFAYRSTDFEVHRNWLAITYSLPLNKWYIEETSPWTLDYPPFFAWFEYLLSLVAQYFDPEMLKVENLNYSSNMTVVFQRLSVIMADLMLALGIREISKYMVDHRVRKSSKWRSPWASPSTVIQVLVLCNAGLFILDHIHFQYNGFLFGILLLSISNILKGDDVWGAFWFVVLINFKHIFLYMAPAYFIYLLKNYCFHKERGQYNFKEAFGRTCQLAGVTLSITLLSFGPFMYFGQLSQVVSRLFPFKRGLTHAYWAPNFWALYNLTDKLIIMTGRALGLEWTSTAGSMTAGKVQEYEHAILPTITPVITLILTIVFITPCLYKLWVSPTNPYHFVRVAVLCSWCAFMFGWHVHEKAILIVIIPLSFLAVVKEIEGTVYAVIAPVGLYSILPLLYTPFENISKVLIYLLFVTYIFTTFADLYATQRHWYQLPLLSTSASLYVFGMFFVFLYENFGHWLLNLDNKYPFLPLLITSCYCAVGNLYCLFYYYYTFLTMREDTRKRKTF